MQLDNNALDLVDRLKRAAAGEHVSDLTWTQPDGLFDQAAKEIERLREFEWMYKELSK